ncbi:MAG: hypothetical protein HQM04_06320 [Magnetococcales bacterium]|nr:hypothetical protein [Magnetococcales bacterium]MBF0114642.1 hypothetical protein [Magnetococcales bacterium]
MKRYLAPWSSLLAVVLALAAAAKPLAEGSALPDTWLFSVGAIVVAVVATLFWRGQEQPVWGEDDQFADEALPDHASTPLQSVQALLQALQGVQATFAERSLPDILHELERIHGHWVLPLAHRQSHLQAGGDRRNSSHLSALLASGELQLNRARSTAGDRYREETRQAIAQAVQHFEALRREMGVSGGVSPQA